MQESAEVTESDSHTTQRDPGNSARIRRKKKESCWKNKFMAKTPSKEETEKEGGDAGLHQDTTEVDIQPWSRLEKARSNSNLKLARSLPL